MADTTGAAGIVRDKFETAQGYAHEAWTAAEGFLARLGGATRLNYPHARVAAPPAAPIYPDAPRPPDLPPVSLEAPVPPALPDLEAFSLDGLEFPDFPAIPPDIHVPEAPELSWPVEPGPPPDMSDVEAPPEPEISLPAPPVFDPVAVPDLPGLILPLFEGQRPPAPDFEAPGNLFVHAEPRRDDGLSRLVAARLARDIEAGGRTGPDDAVEEAFRRGRDRLARELEDRLAEMSDDFAARGAGSDCGPLQAAMGRARRDFAASLVDLDRDIGVRQAEMDRLHLQFCLDKAIALEAQDIEGFNRAAERALESSKALAQYGYAALDAGINVYNARLSRYQADAAVFEARIRAAVGELEAYKTRLEGARLASDVQARAVEVYTAQVAGVAALVGVYASRVEAAGRKAEMQKARLEAYETRIQAYVAGVNANTARLNAHAAGLAGLETRARVHGEAVKAHAIRFEALKSAAELRLTAAREANATRLQAFQADTGRYEAETRLAAARAETALKGQEGALRGYEGLLKSRELDLDARAREYAGKVDVYLKSAEVSIKEADMLLGNALNEMRIEAEKIRSGAQVSAQMAASALSSVNASAQIGYSESKGERTATNVTDSTQRSVSDSTSRSAGYRESISHNYNYRT